MKTRHLRYLTTALIATMALFAAACSSDDSADDGDSDSSAADVEQVGEGTTVNMARANWSTGYMQAAIYEQLLEELGYEVTDPAQNELDPATFFPAAATGDVDFWVNTWTPVHDFQFGAPLPACG